MLSSAAPKPATLSETQELTRNTGSLISRKVWLPKLFYDALPYFYLTAGFAAFFATLYISDWFWVLPHYLLFSAACVHLGVLVLRRRTRPRTPDADAGD
ncbi:MAG: hypothetical protein ACR2QX_00365 [Woeseiaceae bacterium]